MKTNPFKVTIYRFLTVLTASSLIFLHPVSAQTSSGGAVIKYIGRIKDVYTFNIAFENEHNDKFLLSILDATGNTLFAGTYNEKKFDKQFKLLKEGNEKIDVIIKNLKEKSVQTFEIKTTTEVVNDIVVRKII